GKEKLSNWSLHHMRREEFIDELLNGQPAPPAYFPNTVMINRTGASPFTQAVNEVKKLPGIRSEEDVQKLNKNLLIIDGRDSRLFIAVHLKGAVNIAEGPKFDTWLGTVISPGEKIYLTAKSSAQLDMLINRLAYLGYENQIEGAFLLDYVNEAE